MKKISIKEITNNLDNRRIPLNSSQRAEKETNPMYPYIGANNIMGYIDEYIFDDKILCVAEDGGSWGYQETCAKIYNEKVWVNNHAHVLTAKEELVLEYLMYYLNYADLSLHINGATRGKLTKSSLNEIKIPLPPLDQQKKIAAILDAADAYRQKTKALIAKYDELTQSLFLDMFGDPVTNPKGWDIVPIETVCSEIVDCVNKTAPSVNYETDFKMIRTPNVREYSVNLKDVRHVSEETFLKWNRRLTPAKGDIVFTREAPVGQAGIIDFNEKVFLGQRTMLYRVEPTKANNIYVLYQLMGAGVQRQMDKLGMGSTVKHLSVPACKVFNILLPDLALQNQFAERVKKVNSQKSHTQSSLQKAENLFNSLLLKAFKGELTA